MRETESLTSVLLILPRVSLSKKPREQSIVSSGNQRVCGAVVGMSEDNVLQKAQELLERSAALERELDDFYRREAEKGMDLESQSPEGAVNVNEHEHID